MVMLAVEEKEEIANANYRLIYHVAGKFKNQGYPFEELVSAAQVGFTKALNNYRNDKEVKFATFASTCMTNEILMFIRKAKKRRNEVSIDAVVFDDGKGGEITLLDTLTSDNEEEYDWKEINEVVSRVLSNMIERDKDIFKMFVAGKKQREVAEHFNLSQSYVSRIWMRTLQKIKKEYWREEPRTMAKAKWSMTVEEFIQLRHIEKKSYVAIGKIKGVSDVTIHNWEKKNKQAIQQSLGRVKTLPDSETATLVKQTLETAGEQKYDVLEAAIKKLKEEKAEWQYRAAQAEKQLKNIDNEHESIKQSNMELMTENQKLKEVNEKASEIAEELRTVKEENSELKNELYKKSAELESLKESHNYLSRRLEKTTKQSKLMRELLVGEWGIA